MSSIARPWSSVDHTRRSLWGPWLWRLPVILMVALVLLPVSVIVFSWSDPQTELWQHLIETQLARLLGNTLILVLGVGFWTLCLGVSLAWLTAVCDFPGRRWLDWALMLPLAIPTYVVAFVFLGIMDYAGPVQSLWRSLFGADTPFLPVRGPLGVVFVMTCVLYPYVYMLARSAFITQGRGLTDAARLLGQGPWRSFWSVAMPMARPAIAVGVSLALMETLADFGGVAAFNYDTFTTAIYQAWFGFYNLTAAAQLASLLLLFVALALYAEQKGRGGRRFHHQPKRDDQRYCLKGGQAWLASGYCLMVFVVAFAVPIVQLFLWAVAEGSEAITPRFWSLIQHTFILGGAAALATTLAALLVAYGQRLLGRHQIGGAVRLASMGYALPGAVLAVGIMIAFAFIDRQLLIPMQQLFGLTPRQLLVGSLVALILAYAIRFFSVAIGPVQAGLERIRPSYQEAAQSLGASQMRLLWRIYVPLLTPGILTAFLLVLVDTMKELPATLMLRPFGWDTLAVRVYELTGEGEWQRAALPALTLVLLSIAPVMLMIRRTRFTARAGISAALEKVTKQ
ncbi:iron ABC transporter permease [Marinimicrobium sp. ABcell2]|uniref:ABC transporter permease n=1 Tax=Marinimicrobium sp. ABcell2 TaxID=3069751 RepID=UPI0027AFA7D1|nr:iron ABC transporter permease [Marinimicrobium sp. ABcell2]MDQ2076087.1 iron ABC transporter permease [Marinimicrobium sp. ABcell2]